MRVDHGAEAAAALKRLELDPNRVVLVTDIGCQGISDQYFDVHAIHGQHGRSLTYAQGVHLADPDLKVIRYACDRF